MLIKQAKNLALLLGLAVILSAIAGFATRAFHAQQAALGRRWFERGNAALSASQASKAVSDFRNALLYAPDNSEYRFQLAKALAVSGRAQEASTYFASLWDKDPSNALVNLELARLAAARQDANEALRFFHGAIYGLWPDEPERRRDAARLELIEFLLRGGQTTQADAELIALAAEEPDTAQGRIRLADLFMKSGDYARALTEYRAALKLGPATKSALAGAGQAAFHSGQYGVAQLYLHKAIALGPSDEPLAQMAGIADVVVQLDPYLPALSDRERRSRVIRAFYQAGRLLRQCAANPQALPSSAEPSKDRSFLPLSTIPGTTSPDVYMQWQLLKPDVREDSLRRDPNSADRIMELVFQIERLHPVGGCASLGPADTALALLARHHESKSE